MEISEYLEGRRSCPKVVAPGPTDAQVTQLLQAAVSAPDHGKLRPWRFLVLTDAALGRLGELFVEVALTKHPDLDEAGREREKGKPLRAPMILVVAADVTLGHKVPVGEQVASAVCAAEHVMLAAHAMGLGAMWRTGDLVHSDSVKAALGFQSKDEIVAFIYLGTPAVALEPREKLDVTQFLRVLPEA